MVDFKAIQDKWQKRWADSKVFKSSMIAGKKKFYCLEMFPYPSASFLHMGHVRNFTIGDVITRFKRMNGFNVLYPMGYDSFGLPAENASKKAGIHPREYTEDSIAKIMSYQKRLGLSYDWDRTIATHRPEYYKWNQYFFIKFFEKGLVYRKKASVNFCNHCNTVLANEEVENGRCWRCDNEVVQKELDQWFFKTTAYADQLLDDIRKLDWSDKIKAIQENWIGKSHGVFINFHLDNKEKTLFPIFTTRPDTIYGVTFMVIALNHPKLISYIKGTPYEESVNNFILDVKRAEDADDKAFLEKSGVFTGLYAINPLNNERVPIYAGNFVVADYATGMIMAVPAHDQRDFEFAKKYEIDIKTVIKEETKKTILILHGTGGSSKENWFPWIKKELENHNYSVIVPDLPDPEYPDLDKWLKEVEKYKSEVDANSIIIGHSLGCPTAMQFLQKLGCKIDKLILVAPTHKDMAWDEYTTKYPSKNSHNIRKVSEEFIDWKKIQSSTNKIIVYFSEDDPYIPINVKEMFSKSINGEFIVYKDKGHFNTRGLKSDKFPELLIKILDPDTAYTSDGILINSGSFNGLNNDDAIEKISDFIEKSNLGKRTVQYRLKDWLISRQRYWGTPIPMIYCDNCGTVPVPEKELPLELPDDVDFSTTGNPILTSKTFMIVKCPKCHSNARRETDTMGGFMDSSWYFLRYCSPDSAHSPFDRDAVHYWMPVDQYVGGIEHAVGHLIYSRFFTKVLRDFGMIDIDEPFNALFNQGMVNKDGTKMNKSQGNIVTQDEIENKYGIDTARLFVLFVAAPDKEMEWIEKGVEGIFRMTNRTFKLFEEHKNGSIMSMSNKKDVYATTRRNLTIKKMTEYVNDFKINNAIVELIAFIDYINSNKENISSELRNGCLRDIALLFNPFAPHISEEYWEMIGGFGFSSIASWPEYREEDIDLTLVNVEEMIDNVKRDILSVIELSKIKTPSEIIMIVADPWKYELYSKVIELISSTGRKNISEISRHIMSSELKKHGQEIMKVLPKIVEKLPDRVVSLAQEYSAFSESIENFEKEFSCKITLLHAFDSSEPKAKQAMPGKPAIIVK